MRGFALIVGMALVLAACGSTTGTTATSADVDGAWTLAAGTVDGVAIALVPDYPITMTLEGEQIGGRAACNSYGGNFRSDGSAAVISDLVMTEMGCEPRVGESEQAYVLALSRVDTVRASADSLVMSGPGVELTFTRDARVEDQALLGTVWILDTLIEGETASTVQGDLASLEVNADGTITAGTGCRTMTGEYQLSGSEIVVTTAAMAGACPAELERQDYLVVTVLTDGFSFEIDAGRLTLDSMGGDGLSYSTPG